TASEHRYGRRIGAQRLGRAVASALGVRSPIAKSNAVDAEKIVWLGRRLARQRQHSFPQPRRRRKGRFDLSNVHRREKSETPDQERALSERERSECMKQFIVAIFLCVAFSAVVNAAQRKIAYERGE